MNGPCVKQVVTAILIALDGQKFIATNDCETPQTVCPRADMKTGEGYHLCKSICHQTNHAEINVLLFAGNKANGATIYLTGHTYACEPCKQAAAKAGATIVIGSSPI